MTWAEARSMFLGLPPVEAAQAAEPPDPLPVPVPEADLDEPATRGPPRCEICED